MQISRTLMLCLLQALHIGAWPLAPSPSDADAPPIIGSTRSFLQGLQLRRLDDPPLFCQQIYQSLDDAVAQMLAMPVWLEVSAAYNSSQLFVLVDALVQLGCDDDLDARPDETQACQALRQQGRRELARLEHLPAVQAFNASSCMQRWRQDVAFGRRRGCLFAA